MLPLLSLLATPAHAAWSIGPNFGVTIFDPRGGGDAVTTIAVPGGTGQILPGFMPGLRLGFGSGVAGGQTQFYLDTGFNRVSATGGSFSTLEITGNIQFDFSTEATAPYLTGGIGFLDQSASSDGSSDSALNAILGAGFGVRHRLKNGGGAFRAEARIDQVSEADQFAGGTVVSFKFGFDLRMD
jgi:Outer membrane protein beta-barrel domain